MPGPHFENQCSIGNSLFAKHLIEFCNDSCLIRSSKAFLSDNSFTYVSEAWHMTSWLDHCMSTADAHTSLDNIEIMYGQATTDHIPIAVMINVENVPQLTVTGRAVNTGKLVWSKLTKEDIGSYSNLS